MSIIRLGNANSGQAAYGPEPAITEVVAARRARKGAAYLRQRATNCCRTPFSAAAPWGIRKYLGFGLEKHPYPSFCLKKLHARLLQHALKPIKSLLMWLAVTGLE